MLSYPDRHRFEEIRSRWEVAQIENNDTQVRMVGRKEKPAAQPFNSDEYTNASKFRRKLSQGLSLISLSQRKTTPVRPLLLPDDLSSPVDIPHPHESTRLLSPIRDPSSYGVSVRKVTPESAVNPQAYSNAETMPKQLPRSRTMSYIPRPSRNESASPDSAASVHQNLSPRQYNSSLTTQRERTQEERQIAAGSAFAEVKDQSPSKPSPMRSYTTPNLVNTAHAHGSNNFMSPRRPNENRQSGATGPYRQMLKENSTPATQRHVKRLSNIQEHSPQSLRREDLMAPIIKSKRRSTGLVSASVTRKQRACATPPASSKRKHPRNVAQTPFAAQRAVPKKRSPAGSRAALSEDPYTNTRLLVPTSSPTATKTSHAATGSALSRATTEKDPRKRTFPAPKKRMGGGVLARPQATMYPQGMVNNEVRIPRSSTFHHLVVIEDVPPVPPIPEKYKSASMSMLDSAKKPFEEPMIYPKGTIQDEEFLERSPRSSDCSITALPAVLAFGGVQQNSSFNDVCRKKPRLTGKESNLSIRIPTSGRSFSASVLSSAKSSSLWSAKTPQALDVADIGVSPQVKDYMPVLYWAGRFQSRYDQWRTEAMHVELDPDYHMSAPLAHYNVHQENIAACHIFLQLRELCHSHQAADSLWEFEHKYRQEHDLLGTDVPPLNAKPDDGKQGSLGRAIRKMTPRKSSFVNLLKGKGWNAEDVKSTDGSSDRDVTISKAYETSEENHLGRGRQLQ